MISLRMAARLSSAAAHAGVAAAAMMTPAKAENGAPAMLMRVIPNAPGGKNSRDRMVVECQRIAGGLTSRMRKNPASDQSRLGRARARPEGRGLATYA